MIIVKLMIIEKETDSHCNADVMILLTRKYLIFDVFLKNNLA